ncbi:hypothetical protein I4U23_005108 [Adineta vaga]|nr:hypothetical protein I4U23_005108 [Adineta vaga]
MISEHKPAVLRHFKEQASTTGIHDCISRIYVTSSHADLITRINRNLIDKWTNQRRN